MRLFSRMARAKLEFQSKNGAIPRRPGLDRVIEIVPRRFLRHSFLLLSLQRFDFLASRSVLSSPEAATARCVASSQRTAFASGALPPASASSTVHALPAVLPS